MLILGEEALFQICDLESNQILCEIYLKYLGNEKKGIKMTGRLPAFWIKNDDNVTGPNLCQGSFVYRITDLDLNKGKVWLKEVGIDLNGCITKELDFNLLAQGMIG
jgi:hypothetical protein